MAALPSSGAGEVSQPQITVCWGLHRECWAQTLPSCLCAGSLLRSYRDDAGCRKEPLWACRRS